MLGSHRTVETRDSATEGLAHKLTVSSAGAYAVTCKAPRSCEMEVHWLLLGHMLDLVDTGIWWNFLWGQKHWWVTFSP